MREVSARLRDVLDGGVFSVEWVADLIYGGERRAQNLALLEPRFSWDMSAQVQGSGSCTVLWDDVFGQSVVPREIGDLFSPFGAELQVDVIVSAGAFRERVPMGRFVLDSVPAGVEYAVANPIPPRAELVSPWFGQRRNMVERPVPVADGDWQAWSVLDAGVSYRPGGVSARYTLPSASSPVFQAIFAPVPALSSALDITPGLPYTLSFYASASIPFRANVLVYWLDAVGGIIAIAPGEFFPGAADEWVHASGTFTAPVGAVKALPVGFVRPVSGNAPAGTSAWVMDALMEQSTTVGEFFPPGVSEATTRTVWADTPNASALILEAREVSHQVGEIAPVVVESSVTLDLADYFLRIARDEFPFPTSPESDSMWDEAQRLTGLPVVRSIDDRALPTNITYDEDRLEALGKAFGPSNAWPALTPDGALTARPKEWTAPVDRLELVLDAPLVMRSENVYNRVVVEGKNPDPDGPALRAVAEIRDGFLRTVNTDGSRSPFGGNTYRYSSDFLTTQEQCQAYADQLLPQVSRIRSVTRRVTIPFNPLYEAGDVLILVDPTRQGEESTVRVRSVDHNDGETVLEVEVAE